MKFVISTVLASVLLTGCGGDAQVKPDDQQNSDVNVGSISKDAGQSGSVLVGGVEREISYERSAINDADNVLATRTIYFDFDSSSLSTDDEEILKHHGKYLALNSSATMRIEGHTDERGSREYNIALADRRAQSVKRLLQFQGASSTQVVVISYGEEKPAAFGHNEDAWHFNRRAELVYGE